MRNEALYMRIEEQYAALQHAGFSQISQLLIWQGMVLHQARSLLTAIHYPIITNRSQVPNNH